jgi:hypothetical protein
MIFTIEEWSTIINSLLIIFCKKFNVKKYFAWLKIFVFLQRKICRAVAKLKKYSKLIKIKLIQQNKVMIDLGNINIGAHTQYNKGQVT